VNKLNISNQNKNMDENGSRIMNVRNNKELNWDMIKPRVKRCLKKLEVSDDLINSERFIRFESKNNSWTLKRKRKNLYFGIDM